MSFKYHVDKRHVFVDNQPVLMYFIQEIPFAMDELTLQQKQDKWILSEAAINPEYTLQDIFRWSDYLIAEECHPVIFDLDIVNPEVLRDESIC